MATVAEMTAYLQQFDPNDVWVLSKPPHNPKKRTINMGTFIFFLVIAIIIFIPVYGIHQKRQQGKVRRMQIKDLKARDRERRGDLR